MLPSTSSGSALGEEPAEDRPCVLVVDDDRVFARSVARLLEHRGYRARIADAGALVLEHVESHELDVIITDLNMPEMDGLTLLHELRNRGVEVPVIVLTGEPSVESAIRAVEFGAFRYLLKPAQPDELINTVKRAIALSRLARARRDAAHITGSKSDGQTDLEDRFRAAIGGLWMAYQPIVTAPSGPIAAYEALMRSREPSLPTPPDVLAAAEQLKSLHVLGRATRGLVARDLARLPRGCLCFVNLHAADLTDPELYLEDSPLASFARSVVLELTERASAETIGDLPQRVEKLQRLGYRVAIDDLGAGYSGLNYFAQLSPEYAKLDMALVRDVEANPVKQRVILSLVGLCRDLGIEVVAEGVETPAEHSTLQRLGCHLLQGFFFARPSAPFASLT